MTAIVYHADLWGLREVWQEHGRGARQLTGGKYEWLYENDTKTTQWTTVEPKTPLCLFIRQDSELRDEYQRAWKVTEFMRVNSVGIVTARDKLTIHRNDEDVLKVICDFRVLPPEEARARAGGGSP